MATYGNIIFAYNGVDIYGDVSVNYCVHDMYAEKQADSLVIRFNDVKGLWSKWNPAAGDIVTFEDGVSTTGKMFIHSMKPQNGLYTIRALSVPLTAIQRKNKSWVGLHFLQLANEVAGNLGLTFENYGCKDQLYPYLVQNNETDIALFSRICTLEGCQMLLYDGKLIAYNEAYIESQPIAGNLDIGEDGNFKYSNDTSELYGSAIVSGGSFSGSFIAGNGSNRVYRPQTGIQVTSNTEATRFAKGLLREVNKNVQRGIFKRSLMDGYAAASLLTLNTQKASAWDGSIFVRRIQNDYVQNSTTFYFRKLLEGY
jgi:hypothetical protein